LLITIDTLRADRLSCYKPDFLKTPHIDALAARGTIPLYRGVHDNFNFIIREEMGRLFKYLESQNLIENTAIIFYRRPR